MLLNYNVSYDVASLFILIVLAFIYRKYFKQEKLRKHLYFQFINISVLMCAADIISCYMISNPYMVPLWLNMLVSEIYYLSTVSCGFLFYCYVSNSTKRKHKILDKLATGYYIFYEILVILNPVARLFFYFDENMVYTHTKLVVLSACSPYILMFMGYIILMTSPERRNYKSKILHGTLIFISLFTAVVQFLFPNILMGALGTAFGAVILLFCFESPDYNELQRTLKKLDESERDEKKAKEEAEAANEEKSQFLARMSHEIRTPLNAVMGLNEMILREAHNNDIREYAIKLKSSAQTLLGTVNDILDFSKIESGKLEIVPKNYLLSELIISLIDMESQRARKKGLSFVINVDKALPRILRGDDVRIRQIITNLLTNAIKYTNEGEVTLSIKGELDGERLILQVSVKDTGIGIKEENITKLFDEFERIDEEKNHSIEGTGLGINITSSLLELMDSRLVIESEYGKGSEFSFSLVQQIIDETPIGDIEEEIKNSAKEYIYQASFSAPDAKILVVDDTDLNLYVVKQLLKQTLIDITTASSAEMGIGLLKDNHYDVIFMDHMMPIMDGIEALHIIREKELCPDTPVIAFTANAMTGVEKMYLSEGFSGYISKPLNQEDLEEKLLEFLPREYIKAPVVLSNDETEQNDLYDKICNTKVFDLQTAIKNTGDKQSFIEILEQYANTYKTKVGDIKELYNKRDIKGYRIAVHSMKSSSALVGLMKLSGLSKDMEDAARNEEVNYIDEMFEAYLEEINKIDEILDSIFEKEEGGEEEVQIPIILAVLSMLRNALEDFDVDEMDKQIKVLLAQPFPDSCREERNQLQILVSELKSDEAIEVITKIEEKIREVD